MSDTTNWPWPDEMEGHIAAPRHHQLIFENEKVRVIRTWIPAGERTPVHTHRNPAVYMTIKAGDFIRMDAEGNVTFDTRTAPKSENPAAWMGPIPPHMVENVGNDEILVINFEVK